VSQRGRTGLTERASARAFVRNSPLVGCHCNRRSGFCGGAWMRIWLAVVVLVLPSVSEGQTTSPPWPELSSANCESTSPPVDVSQRGWKRGQPEEDEYVAAMRLFQLKNYAGSVEGFSKFAEHFPDSDYRNTALILEMAAQGYLKDFVGQVRVASQLVQLPSAEPSTREVGYVTLCAVLAPYVRSDDPAKAQKLTDLETWARCARDAVAATTRTSNTPENAFETTRRTSESVLDRTVGYVALMRENFSVAVAELEQSAQLNSDDALTYLWLADAELLAPDADANKGIFYLARSAGLSNIPAEGELLKRLYTLVHGSDRGLSDVRRLASSVATPPTNFNILPAPRKSHHYGTILAVAGVVGLLTYAAVKCPTCFAGVGGSTTYSGPSKVIMFGGPGHRTYLGCLTCDQFDGDSVFNQSGKYGSPYSTDSVLNHYGAFGSLNSDYSACNPYATDPPVMVDTQGAAYGRLTLNRLNPQIGAGQNFYNWLASTVCQE
jgi:hypothetical protein